MKNHHNSIKLTALLTAVWLVMAVPAFWIFPAVDDFKALFPIWEFRWEILLPNFDHAARWLPMRNIVRYIGGMAPAHNAAINHAIVIVGHGLSAACIYLITRNAGASSRIALWFPIIFLISPAVAGTAWSVDSEIQAMSTCLGLVSVLLYLLPKRSLALIGWLVAAWLSALWKESGISWFLVTPLLAALIQYCSTDIPEAKVKALRQVPYAMALGLIMFGAYFAIRMLLSDSLTIGADEGRYALQKNPISWARNFIMLMGVALSTIDTITLFGRPQYPWLAALSFAGGIPLLAIAIRQLLRNKDTYFWLLAICAAGFITGPHLLLGHVSEMYAHPVLAVALVIIAPGVSKIPYHTSTTLKISLALFIVTSLSVDYHKYYELYNNGQKSRHVGLNIAHQTTGNPPRTVCIVSNVQEEYHVYSIYQSPAGHASSWGRSVLPEWKWKYPEEIVTASSPEICPNNVDAIWSISTDGNVKVYSQPDDKLSGKQR